MPASRARHVPIAHWRHHVNLTLHLGCGAKRLAGFVNVDILEGPTTDVVADIRDLPFDPGTVDEIYSCSALEHISRHEWRDALRYWATLLVPGGFIYLSVPDFAACARYYLEHGDIEEITGLVIGGQKDDYDWHGVIFDEASVVAAMRDAGLLEIERYEWREHAVGQQGLDDFSQAYLPHMDKEKGTLMMLNIRGRRP